MSIPYVIILSESEDEHDDAPTTIYLSDSDTESHHSESAGEEGHPAPENVTTNGEFEEEPSEEDPSEEDPSEEEPFEDETSVQGTDAGSGETVPETPIPSPPTLLPNYTSGPRIIHTARKRVAIPRRRATSSSESSIPSTDPYLAPNSTTHRRTDARRWTWLPETLQTWREEEGFPIITEEGESSTAGREYPLTREPPHHTVPLLVARMSTQELRIDHVEDALEEMPGTEAYENLGGEVHTLEQHVETMHDRVSNLEQHFVEVGEATQEMASRERGHINRIQSLESRMALMEHDMISMQGHIDRLTAMAAATRECEAIILRGDHLPKKV